MSSFNTGDYEGKLAAYACLNHGSELSSCIDIGFFYKALSYVSYDLDETALTGLLQEAEQIEHEIGSGGVPYAQEDH